jgi:PAS domain S-box-containing protein
MEHPPLRVLLIDDEEVFSILLRRMLKNIPGKTYEIQWASSYEAGLEVMREQRHDVYLLDHYLGARTGLDLLREAGKLGLSAPIIMLTGAADPTVDAQAAELGAADYLLKDKLDPTVLERSIRYSVQQAATFHALQRSNERFRLLFERSMDAILISDDQGRFVEVNGAACKLLGASRDRLLKMKWSDLVSNAEEIRTDHREDGLGELSVCRANGERRFIEFSASQLAADLNLSILRDVTESRDLEREIQQVSEREQRRIGQDLHDGLGQTLTGIAFMAKTLQNRLEARGREEASDAGTIATLINEGLVQARRMSRGLCPTVLEDNDIDTALEQLAENMQTFFNVKCEFKCDEGIRISDNAVVVHLYRIAQEAATNAVKHGKANEILISLKVTTSGVVLRIQDNGCGLPKTGPKKTGMGLRVIQHRARMIGGTATIRPRKGECGVVVTCTLRKNILAKKPSGKKGGDPIVPKVSKTISLQRTNLQNKLGLAAETF